ncbi:hypothetical protein KAU08_12300 [bacterium]|nr:hypothetical protein [bacterium]
MRIPGFFLITLSFIFIFTLTACPGGDDSSDTQDTTPTDTSTDTWDAPLPIQRITFEQPEDRGILDIMGTDVIEFMVEWEALGQDSREMTRWLSDEDEGQYKDVDEWHISQFENGETAVFEMEAGEGVWMFQAFGGTGVLDLDLAIYGDEGELLAEDAAPDNYPMVSILLEEPTPISIEIIPAELIDGYDDAWYGWYYN